MHKNMKAQLKRYYQNPSPKPAKAHMAQTARLSREAYAAGRKRSRMGFPRFLLWQLGLMEKKFFIVQGAAMLFIALLLYRTAFIGSLSYTYPAFLGGCGMLFALINVPFLQRSSRYKMLEIELSTRMSLPRLLFGRLIIIGAMNLATVTLIGGFGASRAVTVGMPVYSGLVFVFLPYLLACIGCVCIINVSRGRMGTGYSILLCGVLFGLLFLLTKVHPDLFLELYVVIWWLACIPVLAVLAAVLRGTLKRGGTLDKIRVQ